MTIGLNVGGLQVEMEESGMTKSTHSKLVNMEESRIQMYTHMKTNGMSRSGPRRGSSAVVGHISVRTPRCPVSQINHAQHSSSTS